MAKKKEKICQKCNNVAKQLYGDRTSGKWVCEKCWDEICDAEEAEEENE